MILAVRKLGLKIIFPTFIDGEAVGFKRVANLLNHRL